MSESSFIIVGGIVIVLAYGALQARVQLAQARRHRIEDRALIERERE